MTVLAPASLDAALRALAEHPDAHVLAGGTDFMVEVNAGHRRPEAVVAIGRVPELRGWAFDPENGVVSIGAATTYTELMTAPLAARFPALADAARAVGSPQIRHAGTLGGNLGTCSPAGDTLPVLSALDAVIELASTSGRRTLSIHEFMVGVKRTALRPGELVARIDLPVIEDGWQGFAKVGVRNAMVISSSSACLVLDRPRRRVAIALGAVGPTIIRARDAETWIAGRIDWPHLTVERPVAEEFGRLVAAAARPIDDHRSTAAYRRHSIAVLGERLLLRAARP